MYLYKYRIAYIFYYAMSIKTYQNRLQGVF